MIFHIVDRSQIWNLWVPVQATTGDFNECSEPRIALSFVAVMAQEEGENGHCRIETTVMNMQDKSAHR